MDDLTPIPPKPTQISPANSSVPPDSGPPLPPPPVSSNPQTTVTPVPASVLPIPAPHPVVSTTLPPPTPPIVPPPSDPPQTKISAPQPGTNNHRKAILFIIITVVFLISAIFIILKFMGGIRESQTKTLTYWGLWEDQPVMRPVLDEYEKTHPKIKVDYKMQNILEYRERLKSALDQHKGPDIFRIHDSWIPMFRENLSPVPADIYSASEYEKIFYPVVKDTLRIGANYVAIPLEVDGLAMYINDDLFGPTGYSVPKTWDEVRKAALAMSKCQTPDGVCRLGSQILISGTAMGSTKNVDHWQEIISAIMMQNNVNLYAPANPNASDVLSFYSNFNRAFGIWNDDLPSSTKQFASGKVGIYFGPSWRVFDIKTLNKNLKFSIHPLPQLPIVPERNEKEIYIASYWVESVNSSSSSSKEAWELLKYLSSKEVMQKLYSQAQKSGRDFGEPFSRRDLADQIKDNPYIGSFIKNAELARSWYLASSTLDGQTGINQQLSDEFAKAINGQGSVEGVAAQINNILSKYGFASVGR